MTYETIHAPSPLELQPAANIYEDQMWILHGEMMRFTPDAKKSALDTALIQHFISVGDVTTASCLIVGNVTEDETGVARSSLAFDDRLSLLNSAIENGCSDVLIALGDLRSEAEPLGPIALGSYLCEEVAFGWNITNNMDDLGTIIQHGGGKSENLRRKLINSATAGLVSLWKRGDMEEYNYLLSRLETLDIAAEESCIKLINVIEQHRTLEDTIPRSSKRRKHLKGVIDTKNQLRETKLNVAFEYAALNAYEPLEALLSDEQEKGYCMKIFFEFFSPNYRAIIAHQFPEIMMQFTAYETEEVKQWHSNFLSLDVEPETSPYHSGVEYPENIRFLEKWLSGRTTAAGSVRIINKLSLLARRVQGEESQPDVELAAGILVRLDFIKQEMATEGQAKQTSDLVSQLRHQLRFNHPLAELFNQTTGISDGITRLTTQIAVFETQQQHDIVSADSEHETMRDGIIDTIIECRKNPLYCIDFGTDNLAAILVEYQKAKQVGYHVRSLDSLLSKVLDSKDATIKPDDNLHS